jgi:hypothetical protein
MENITYIYALVDPKERQEYHIYIGKSNNPYLRYYQYLKDKLDLYKTRWIKSLLKLKLSPELQILEQCNFENWEEREKDWIKFYKDCNYKVVNGMEGGSGGVQFIEIRHKMSKTHTGMHHSLDTINKMKHPHKSYDKSFLTPEYKKEVYGKRIYHPMSEEQKQKLRHPHKSYNKNFLTPEYKKFLCESRKGRIPWNKGKTYHRKKIGIYKIY